MARCGRGTLGVRIKRLNEVEVFDAPNGSECPCAAVWGTFLFLRLDDHGGSNFDALEKIFDVEVMHADTSFGHGLPNTGRVICSVNPIMWDR